MLQPSLELPKIPAATIMELRSEDGLRAASDASTEHFSYYQTAEWLEAMSEQAGDTSYWTREEQRAFEIGIRIGQSLGHQLGKRDAPDAFEHVESRRAIATLETRYRTAPSFTRFVEDRLEWVDKDRSEADRPKLQVVRLGEAAIDNVRKTKLSDSFDTIARAHVGMDKNLLIFSKYGACAVHSTVYAIDVERYNRLLNPSVTSVGHLDLAL